MKKVLFLSIFFLISVFIGYENPHLIEVPKKHIKFTLKSLKLIDNFVIEKDEIETTDNEKFNTLDSEKLIVEGNSFNLVLEKKINFDDRTAGFFIEQSEKGITEFDIYLQNGVNINNTNTKEIFLPKDIYFEQNGGVKTIFKVKEKKFVLASNKKNNCAYATIYEIEIQKIILETKCIPDNKNVDFNGLGGAVVKEDDFIYISIGAPEWDSKEISSLAQRKDYFYGKIIKTKKENFINYLDKPINFDIFTYGHKNPQGLIIDQETFFSIEHGPQGGDEINLINENKNYGWPDVSYGTEYNNGESYKKNDEKYEKPLFTFLPSIAPSSLERCPKNLKKYYTDEICLIFLTLRDMSLYVVLIDKLKLNVISYEKFKIGERLRHFGKKDNQLYEKDSMFFISADGEGVFSAKFDNFR